MNPDERATGIVLRTRLLTESSLIVHWLTAEAGRVATVARGARRPKSAFRGKLDLFHEADFGFRRSTRSELHTLTEVALRGTFPGLREDWHRLSQAAYAVTLVEQTTETDTPLPGTWELFRGYLERVQRGPGSPFPVLALELRHLAELGLLPELERGTLPEAARRLAGALADPMTWEVDEDLGRAGEPVWRTLERFLGRLWIDHLGRLPRGRAEALAPAASR